MSTGYLRVDPSGAVEILVEQAQARDEIDAEAARKDLAAAEAELGKWGDKPHDGEYTTCPRCSQMMRFDERFSMQHGRIVNDPAWICQNPVCRFIKQVRAVER